MSFALQTQLFNGNSVISKRSKMIKEGSKLRASATSLTHKQVYNIYVFHAFMHYWACMLFTYYNHIGPMYSIL